MKNENEKEPAAKNLIDTVRRELKWPRRIMWAFGILIVVSFVDMFIRGYSVDPEICGVLTCDMFSLLLMVFLSYSTLYWETVSERLCHNLAHCALKGRLIIAKIATRYRLLVVQLREAETIDEVRTIIKTLDPETETKEPPPEK